MKIRTGICCLCALVCISAADDKAQPENKTTVANVPQLLEHVAAFVDGTNVAAHIRILSADRHGMALNRFKRSTDLNFTTLTAGAIPKGSNLMPSDHRPRSDLEPKTVVSGERVAEFTNWCHSAGIQCVLHYGVYMSPENPGRVEGYSQACRANPPNWEALTNTIVHLIEKTLSPMEMPLEIIEAR